MPETTQDNLLFPDIPKTFSAPGIIPKFNYIPHLNKTLDTLDKPDVFHIQGLWELGTCQTANYAKKHRTPYVISLRGMLYPQALGNQSRIGKKLARILYQDRLLINAKCIQVTCESELKHFRDLKFKTPAAIIPNAVNLSDAGVPTPPSTCFRIGYLGRIHARKKIDQLLYAAKELSRKFPTELVIMGDGDAKLKEFLKAEARRLNFADQVRFTGYLSGEEKKSAIRQCSVIVMPSDFESFGNVVMEALLYGVPAIASASAPWKDLNTFNCGWHLDNNEDALSNALTAAASLNPAELQQMGLNGQRLVAEKYNQEHLGLKLEQLYLWCKNEISSPDFIITD
jgi:glycosyltransferase involved in cell wall biosynthesis